MKHIVTELLPLFSGFFHSVKQLTAIHPIHDGVETEGKDVRNLNVILLLFPAGLEPSSEGRRFRKERSSVDVVPVPFRSNRDEWLSGISAEDEHVHLIARGRRTN